MWKYIIDDFKTFLKVEKSLTQNSIDAYITDMSKLTQFFEITQPNIKPGEVTTKHLRSFINWLNELNITATTQARIISGIKAFFKYLVYEEIIEDSPADLIDAPKRGRKIPEILAIEEIINMITAIDLTKQEGYRNTAIIETLYGCGLRVSELTELKISNLFFDMEFIKVKGKGEEERLVPICKEAMQAINKYMKETRQKQKPKDGNEDYLFLNRRGSKLSRVMIHGVLHLAGYKDVSDLEKSEMRKQEDFCLSKLEKE